MSTTLGCEESADSAARRFWQDPDGMHVGVAVAHIFGGV